MSNRANEYRELIEDIIAGGLLEEDERLELRDMLARVQRRIQANVPVDQPSQEAAE